MNPKFKQFIVNKKNGIHIINVNLTVEYLNKAIKELTKIVLSDGYILFVGTKNQAKDIVQYTADRCGMFYIIERWLGGTLTNWKTISKSIKKLDDFEIILSDKNTNTNLSKKELLNISRDKEKLDLNLGGIRNLGGLPDILLVFDAV